MGPAVRILLAGALAFAAAGCRGAASIVHKAAPASASTDPYTASLRYAVCMRGHGVPHPNPDRSGNFRLTPAAEERRMRSVPRSTREAAGNSFRNSHPPPLTKRLQQPQHTCEKRVNMAGQLDRIIADDRSGL
jgi:hypothetical protein